MRDPWEWDAGNLEALGALHIPLAELLDRADELPEARPLVTYCKTGSRSADGAERLRGLGYPARNLSGGLAAWAIAVDPSVTVA